ncbi:MAG: SH3 domain-containing protein [Sarcina sp.]
MKKFLCSFLILASGLTTVPALANQSTNLNVNTNTTKEISPKAQYGVITANNVQYRSAPGLSSTVYGQVHKGAKVGLPYVKEVYKDGLWWTNILYNNKSAWVASKYVKMV